MTAEDDQVPQRIEAGEGRDGMDAAFAAVDGGLATFGLTVLPMDATEDGLFIYDEAAIDLVKELKAAGVDAGYAHDSKVRRYYSERSAESAVSLLINLASAAIWETLMLALQRYRNRQKLRVTIVDAKLPDGTEHHFRRFEGSGQDVLEAMRIHRDTRNGS
ncbi:hypothetical protein ABZ799_28460 [Nocardiopsis dassonvillei]|uniref:hypothetical protein n=1 Tax=Nocardiopsis dassonvillei TaxID=2014 RepID=UPI00340E4996